MYDILIIGGGLAGLINAIQLSKRNFKVMVVEKKAYPFDKVCGEYISNEVVPFLKSINAFPEALKPPSISRFQISAISGEAKTILLPLGGFGMSRYVFDEFLFKKALESGAEFMQKCTVQDVQYQNGFFKIKLREGGELEARIVIGSFGKRSEVDKKLDREFIRKSSPYIGVKYHIKYDFPRDMVALHNFKDGYCGLSAIEGGKTNLCYLSRRENLRNNGTIKDMETAVLSKNRLLKSIFENAEFLSSKPEVINEISFSKKKAVEHHILMSGDSAGLISPLCGNGMAMAIHSAHILSRLIVKHLSGGTFNRQSLEEEYSSKWNQLFSRRLWIGRNTQKLFGSSLSSSILVGIVGKYPRIAEWIIRQTHGDPF